MLVFDCSACHNITIRNVHVEEAGVAVAIWGGDCGYEFAREADRSLQHSGYVVDNVTIDRALLFGLVLNGSADNVYRARRDFGYQTLIDPVHPGLNRPSFETAISPGAAIGSIARESTPLL